MPFYCFFHTFLYFCIYKYFSYTEKNRIFSNSLDFLKFFRTHVIAVILENFLL